MTFILMTFRKQHSSPFSSIKFSNVLLLKQVVIGIMEDQTEEKDHKKMDR